MVLMFMRAWQLNAQKMKGVTASRNSINLRRRCGPSRAPRASAVVKGGPFDPPQSLKTKKDRSCV